MERIVGSWQVSSANGEVGSSEYRKDGTFTAQAPSIGTINGRFAFHNGYYILERGGSILSAFQILFYDTTSMKVGMNTGEIQTCYRKQGSELQPGCRVTLKNLVGNPTLNGCAAVIRRFDTASSRYVVFVEQRGQEMKVREQNIRAHPSTTPQQPNPVYQQQQQVDPFTAMIQQQTAQLNQRNVAIMEQLRQQTERQNQRNAQMLQQLNRYTATKNQQTLQMLSQLGGAHQHHHLPTTSSMLPGQQQQYYIPGAGGFPQQQHHQQTHPQQQFLNAVASNIDPSAAGEFAGAAAAEFVQGVGFDVGSIVGGALGGLFGL